MQVLEAPPVGARTLWEDRCNLVHQDNSAEVASLAKFIPSAVLAEVLPAESLAQAPAVYPPDASAEDGGRESLMERVGSHLQAAVAPLRQPLALVWSWLYSATGPRPAALPSDWHPRQLWLAAADPSGRVRILDYGAARKPANGGQRPELLRGGYRAVLAHASRQPEVHSLAWCPTSPGLLAVGTRGGVCLWAVAGEARPPLAGRSTGPWLHYLRTRVPGASVASLSWSPDGRLLAAALPQQAGLQVWDASSGCASPVSAGPAAFSLVRWSPCGNYVFAGNSARSTFHVFDAQSWKWAQWDATGPVVAAAWAPSAPGRMAILLLAVAGQAGLIALHLVAPPPCLSAQLLTVVLPGLQAREPTHAAGAPSGLDAPEQLPRASGSLRGVSSRAAGASPGLVIADICWEPCGSRLAVLLAAPHPASQLLALYATSSDPVVSARLLGFARPPDSLCQEAAAADASALAAAAATARPSAAGASSLCTQPGSLAAAKMLPAGSGLGAVFSARVGDRGVYVLPAYF